MIATYLVLAQIGVAIFFRPQGGPSLSRAISNAERRITRRASRWGSWRHHTPPSRPATKPTDPPKPPPSTDSGTSVPLPTA